MKIYLDLVIIINFFFDFILLFTTGIILKRKLILKRLFLGAIIGSLTILTLFYPFTSFQLFILKILISIIIIITSYGYKSLKYTLKNLFYFYISSIFLGGSLYLLNIEFSYKNDGLIFYHNGLSINFILMIILTPIIIYLYIKQSRDLKMTYSNYYKVSIYLKDNTIIKTIAFLDTGNGLKDPYKKRPIILLNKSLITTPQKEVLVPYHSLNNTNLLKCIIPKKIDIETIGQRTNFLIGLSEEKFSIDGVDCILNSYLLERIN